MNRARYPVYIISKGRADCGLTARFMIRDKIDFKLVVEPQERDIYAQNFGAENLLILPFSNLGLGSIPARNWCWEHSKAQGHCRHWIFDDNIRGMYRGQKGLRFRASGLPMICAAEDFVDRYTNIGIAGFNYSMFFHEILWSVFKPFYLNVHVYSALLIDNSLPYRWRGRYNEDTDLCLQVLSGGWCTVLFNAFLIEKLQTMQMKGGNTDSLYKGDGRLKMARSLERVWPYVVQTKRRFKRPQHIVHDSWRKFDTKLIRRPDVDFANLPRVNEYGMKLVEVHPIASKELKIIVDELKASRDKAMTPPVPSPERSDLESHPAAQ